jgi:ParB family transcriptional regulator, chromosome partitioning protein
MPRNALGKGLSALIREPEPPPPPVQELDEAPLPPAVSPTGAAAAAARAPAREGLVQVDIDLIDPSPYQPRTRFREETLAELARSIEASGIVQPLVARKLGNRYQLIAGERRWRAAQRAGLTRVPVLVREVPEELALEMALVENLQREDLNAIEQARAFERLMEEFALTQEQVAERTGKDRATIANSLRLLRLEEPIQELLEDNRIAAGHARALLAIADSTKRVALARKIARSGMTVRQVERLAARSGKPGTAPTPWQMDPNTKAALEELERQFGTRVMIHPIQAGRAGQLIFEYYDQADLTRLYDRLIEER